MKGTNVMRKSINLYILFNGFLKVFHRTWNEHSTSNITLYEYFFISKALWLGKEKECYILTDIIRTYIPIIIWFKEKVSFCTGMGTLLPEMTLKGVGIMNVCVLKDKDG